MSPDCVNIEFVKYGYLNPSSTHCLPPVESPAPFIMYGGLRIALPLITPPLNLPQQELECTNLVCTVWVFCGQTGPEAGCRTMFSLIIWICAAKEGETSLTSSPMLISEAQICCLLAGLCKIPLLKIRIHIGLDNNCNYVITVNTCTLSVMTTSWNTVHFF